MVRCAICLSKSAWLKNLKVLLLFAAAEPGAPLAPVPPVGRVELHPVAASVSAASTAVTVLTRFGIAEIHLS